MGRIMTKSKSGRSNADDHNFKQAQIHVPKRKYYGEKRLKLLLKFDIGGKLNIDTTSCCVMVNGEIVFCRGSAGKYFMIIHSKDGQWIKEIRLKYYPVDVTPIDDKMVALTSGRHILLIDIVESNICETIKTNYSVWGVAYRDGYLNLCVEGDGLYRTDIKTYESSPMLQENLIAPSYITTFNDNFAFTESYNKKTVMVFNADFKEVWRISNSQILQRPGTISADNQGNIFVSDSKTKSVVWISADGQHHITLNSDEITFEARCLSFDSTRGYLLLCTTEGKALIFDVKNKT